MTALQNLENDHVHILRLTHVMERMIHVKANNPDHFYTVTDLIRYFADGFHHAKEEKLLFPVLEQKGFSTMQGPVAVMLTEHQMGRSFTQGILKHLRSFEKGKNTDTSMTAGAVCYRPPVEFCILLLLGYNQFLPTITVKTGNTP